METTKLVFVSVIFDFTFSQHSNTDAYIHIYDLKPDIDIADVTYFVKPGQAMDTEAANRGTTVYLVDKRIDMLPALLGTSKFIRDNTGICVEWLLIPICWI